MLSRAFCVLVLASAAWCSQAQTVVSKDGKAKTSIYVSGTSPTDVYAANELAHWLSQITGVTIPVKTGSVDLTLPANSILVGLPSAYAGKFVELKNEQTSYQVSGTLTQIRGGGTRGTLYTVYRLLHKLGVRWWTPWATTIPHNRNLVLPKENQSETPAFESRDPFWLHAFDGDWAARNYSNSQFARLTDQQGGKVLYDGFVHTFYGLVPPDPYFKQHPEWFSLINGQRTTNNAQLCTTNPELRDFIVAQVKANLRKNPQATIVSVSQNDCFNPCQCDVCQALVKEQGSESAPMLALVNYVAEKIEKEFPNVAVDTLAYQYTRKAPKTLRPRPNVIVRLCSIECNFAQPLDSASNKSFADDIRDWSRLTNRLYIWNYTTNFAHYPQPLPNYFTIGPNERFFQANGVKGIFEEGAYQSSGADMPELRAWVQCQLMWNPKQDDKALIDEFLNGYYGAAAKPIRQYLDLIAEAAKDEYATIYDPPTKGFFRFEVMNKAERLWRDAEKRVVNNPDMLWRVKESHLAVQYVFINRWSNFRAEANRTNTSWLYPPFRSQAADNWVAQATSPGPAGWTPMTTVREGDLSPKNWLNQFRRDPPEPEHLPARLFKTPLPAGMNLSGRAYIDLQDDKARLWNEPDGAALRPDPNASNRIAAWMPGSHHEWGVQIPVSQAKDFTPGRYRIIVVARAEYTGLTGVVFSAGVYDAGTKVDQISQQYSAPNVANVYHPYDIGVLNLTKDAVVWIAPPARAEVNGVWIDRVLLVKEP